VHACVTWDMDMEVCQRASAWSHARGTSALCGKSAEWGGTCPVERWRAGRTRHGLVGSAGARVERVVWEEC